MSRQDEKYYSSDEEGWEVDLDPVANVFACGWIEDGRCGFQPENLKQQTVPRPMNGLRRGPDASGKQFVCKKLSAGSRHTLLLMINCRAEAGRFGRKTKKVSLCGLNQVGLCEEQGYVEPKDVIIDIDESPISVAAGYGTSFIMTRIGNVYSFGHNRYGVLGHGDDISSQIPRQIMGLNSVRVKSMSVGQHHAMALSYNGKLFSWGRNDKGALNIHMYILQKF